jgi:uncharacterized protein
MTFDWDESNVAHIARHGISPAECEEAYQNGPVVIEYQLRSREKRLLCLGETRARRLLTLVITERRGSVRIVTAHPMHAKQRRIYQGEDNA